MAEYRKLDIDYFSPDGGKKPKRKALGGSTGKLGDFFRNNKIIIIVSAGVLAVALAAFLLLFTGPKQTEEYIIYSGNALKGVSVGGIDISGMTKQQALTATANLEKEKLAGVKFTLDVNSVKHEYGAGDLSVTSDYLDVIDKAMEYGHTGDFETRQATALSAIDTPVNFDITLKIDENTFQASLDAIKASLDTTPKDATMQFTPWGYSLNQDGTVNKWTPTTDEIKAIVEMEAQGKEYDKYPPNLVTLSADEMPSLLRYEYWDNSKFAAGYDSKTNTLVNTSYRPTHSNIARFYYTPDVEGISVDLSAIADQIRSEVKSGAYDTITVPFKNIDPAVTLESLKSQTQLLSSWTSSFSKPKHYKPNRNWNVSMISHLINGTELKPGAKWSVNDTIGPRDSTTAKTIGWKKAPGIENGGTSPQIGGGVCQLGSTIYNAVLRSGIKGSGIAVDSFVHHSIPSDYIPVGLDATLNTKPARDLVLRNDGKTDYYLISYINPLEKTVTVEIYGPPLVDPTYGSNVIYSYISERTGRFGSENTNTIEVEDGYTAPDGTVVTPDNSPYTYASASRGTTAEVWRLIFDSTGKFLDKSVYSDKETYPPITGTIYECTGGSPTETPPDDGGGGDDTGTG